MEKLEKAISDNIMLAIREADIKKAHTLTKLARAIAFNKKHNNIISEIALLEAQEQVVNECKALYVIIRNDVIQKEEWKDEAEYLKLVHAEKATATLEDECDFELLLIDELLDKIK
jgi:hypothetical protein